MQITLKKRSGKYLDTIEVPETATVEEFKAIFYKKHHFYTERQWWNIGKANGPSLKFGTLVENGVNTNITLYFKDMGVQISWRLVYVIEYLGPLIIFPLFYFFPVTIYGQKADIKISQEMCFYVAILHYLKREFETLFVHRFSNGTMPIYRVPINCGHYWGIFGIGIGYYLFHPNYTPLWDDNNKIAIYTLTGAITIFELLNFKTHLILRSLRPRGTKTRGIPNGWGFSLTSTANYTWETVVWICFSILANTVTAWIFTIVAFAQMTQWALKKHSQYKKQFEDYPKNRKAIIPFLL